MVEFIALIIIFTRETTINSYELTKTEVLTPFKSKNK